MKSTTWFFSYPSAGERYACRKDADEPLASFIEDQLYILWKMRPVNLEYRKELTSDWTLAKFQYAYEPVQTVTIDRLAHSVTVLGD